MLRRKPLFKDLFLVDTIRDQDIPFLFASLTTNQMEDVCAALGGENKFHFVCDIELKRRADLEYAHILVEHSHILKCVALWVSEFQKATTWKDFEKKTSNLVANLQGIFV